VLVGLIHVADTLCAKYAKGFNLTALHQELDPALLSELNLDSAALEQLKTDIPNLVSDAASVFG
jgi:hypothetical protein